MKFTLAAVASLALLGLAAPANAASGPLHRDGVTPAEVVAWLRGEGYKAELDVDSEDLPMVRSAAGPINFDVYFYDCAASRCRAIQFSAGFDLTEGATAARINEWNRDNRYLKAYLDDSNDPTVQYDVNVAPGGTYESLDDDLGLFAGMVGDFARFIGF